MFVSESDILKPSTYLLIIIITAATASYDIMIRGKKKTLVTSSVVKATTSRVNIPIEALIQAIR